MKLYEVKYHYADENGELKHTATAYVVAEGPRIAVERARRVLKNKRGLKVASAFSTQLSPFVQ